MRKPAVLFVCLGNICRSPMAEGAFQLAAEQALARRAVQLENAFPTGPDAARFRMLFDIVHAIDRKG